jgi:DNA-binding beta-propeller fold protein YncE
VIKGVIVLNTKIIAKICLAAIIAAGLSAPARAAPLYALTKTVPLPGGIKWDYLTFDAKANRVYVSQGTEVKVLNGSTGAIIGMLKNLPGSHGIAIDPATGLVYADSADRKLAVAFNPQTYQPVASAPVAYDADGMAYDPASKQIFVSGGDAQVVTPIATASKTAAPDIALGGAPEFLVADGAGSLYENIADQRQIVRIDTAKNAVMARWSVPQCASPHGLAIDPASRRLFATCENGIALVVDADSGKIIATLKIGHGSDAAAFDAVQKRFFSSNGDGTLTVVAEKSPDDFLLLANVKTAPGARTMAIDPATGRIFLVTGTVLKTTPASGPDDHPHYVFAPGGLKLLIFDPVQK